MNRKVCFIVALFCLVFVYAQQKVTICWDASLSMQDRNIEIENEFLEDYFTKHQNLEAHLIIFNTQIRNHNSYSIQSGDWSLIKKDLARVNYDGATSYRSLANQIDGGDILLFTDGKQNMKYESPKFNGTVFVINSKEDYNRENLKLVTVVNTGKFINLIPDTSIKVLQTQSYFGKIYSENAQMKDVTIAIKGSGTNAKSKSDGTSRSRRWAIRWPR